MILTVVKRLTKHLYAIPTKDIVMVVNTAYLLIRYIFCEYRMSEKIMTDRDTQFISKIWKILTDITGIEYRLSMAYYFQTNG
jgi:hypothetical protein